MHHSDLKDEQISRLTTALKQCQELLVQMRDRQVTLESQLGDIRKREKQASEQLTQKTSIIEKLISEKQERMLHPSLCTGEALRDQLKQANQICHDTHRSCNAALENSQESLKRCKKEVQTLKEVNKMLRLQNSKLRQWMSVNDLRKSRRKDGLIVTRGPSSKQRSPSHTNFTITRNQFIEDVTKSREMLFTPEKPVSWKSTILPSTGQQTESFRPYSSMQKQSVEMGRCMGRLMELFVDSQGEGSQQSSD